MIIISKARVPFVDIALNYTKLIANFCWPRTEARATSITHLKFRKPYLNEHYTRHLIENFILLSRCQMIVQTDHWISSKIWRKDSKDIELCVSCMCIQHTWLMAIILLRKGILCYFKNKPNFWVGGRLT